MSRGLLQSLPCTAARPLPHPTSSSADNNSCQILANRLAFGYRATGDDGSMPPGPEDSRGHVKIIRSAAVLISGLLLAQTLPAVASAEQVAAPRAAAVSEEGPGAPGPDLSYKNRTGGSLSGLPDWSRVGYRGGLDLPHGESGLTESGSCRISTEELRSTYKVSADDGVDDTTGLQKAIDYVKSDCSPTANFNRLSIIELPSGRIDVSRQIYVDASFLTIRGQGSGDGGTRLVFRPDLNTRYDTLVNGRWDQDAMVAGTGSDVGKGGWMWPGRGMFRVQTRDLAERYKDDYAAAPANRKDIFEGSINQHWASGFKLAAQDDDPGFSARQGASTVRLDAKANMDKFQVGGYVWVGATNSVKFYEQQGITDTSLMESLHMRQQMFRLSSKDAGSKTITLDRPLEWDLPVDSLSDGSSPLGPTAYTSKVTPLKIVEGVGFEDFAFTQDTNGLPKLGGGTYALTPEQAKNNYGNMAPEYAMHGIVFKWAANSWARGLKATMTGSHPIVTEVARNLQIERNSFDGAWNKGKGGNGYLRGSRVWDSLWAHNLSRNLRHFTFQWSASGNVAFRNDLDSDLNLHGGWEHNNLFEQNTARVPYEHRSANCESNCGGEGGEIDDGTWYPIWWAAGPKAAKWSGSSGPQNVFYNNTLIKQATEGGPFEPYTPYGTRAGTAFQFGSNSNNARQFQPLGQDGQAIADWTGRETLDYQGKGVATLDVGNRHSLFLRNTGGEVDPRLDLTKFTVGSWNMRGSGTTEEGRGVKWNVVADTAETNDIDVLALQEAGTPPADVTLPNNPEIRYISQREYIRIDPANGERGYPRIHEMRLGTLAHTRGWVYWLHTAQQDTIGQNNLAIYTSTRAWHEDLDATGERTAYVVRGTTDAAGVATGRPALGIRFAGTVYWTIHGNSTNQGRDVPEILGRISDRMNTAGVNGEPLRWVVLGDFNRDPGNLRSDISPLDYQVHAPSETTYHGNNVQRSLDYAVTPGSTLPNAITVTRSRVIPQTWSDHHFSLYEMNTRPVIPNEGGGDPRDGDGNPPAPRPVGQRVVLRNAQSQNAAFPSGSVGTDRSAVLNVPVNRNNLEMQGFEAETDPEYPGYYRLRHAMSNMYLGHEAGSGEVYTSWQTRGTEQLWSLVNADDGTWMVVNRGTGHALTYGDWGRGEQLLAAEWDDTDARQRFFLQAADEALGVYEIVDVTGSQNQVLRPLNGSTAEGTPLELATDTEDASETFTAIPAGERNDQDCFYALHQGKYVNSGNGNSTSPADGSIVTLNAYHPDSDGYLLCSDVDPRGKPTVLSQHRTANEFLFLTTRGVTISAALTLFIGSANEFLLRSRAGS